MSKPQVLDMLVDQTLWQSQIQGISHFPPLFGMWVNVFFMGEQELCYFFFVDHQYHNTELLVISLSKLLRAATTQQQMITLGPIITSSLHGRHIKLPKWPQNFNFHQLTYFWEIPQIWWPQKFLATKNLMLQKKYI